MRAARILADREGAAAAENVKDLKLLVISVGRTTRYLLNLRLADQYCVASASALIAPHNQELNAGGRLKAELYWQ